MGGKNSTSSRGTLMIPVSYASMSGGGQMKTVKISIHGALNMESSVKQTAAEIVALCELMSRDVVPKKDKHGNEKIKIHIIFPRELGDEEVSYMKAVKAIIDHINWNNPSVFWGKPIVFKIYTASYNNMDMAMNVLSGLAMRADSTGAVFKLDRYSRSVREQWVFDDAQTRVIRTYEDDGY